MSYPYKSHCKQGHLWTEESTRYDTRKQKLTRRCILCAREAVRRTRAKQARATRSILNPEPSTST